MKDIILWKVKGYTGFQLKLEDFEKQKYSFEEIDDKNLTKEIKSTLKNGGVVFGLSKKNIVKAVYTFKLETRENKKILICDKKIILEETTKCTKEFERDLNGIFSYILADRIDIDKVIFNKQEVTLLTNIKKSNNLFNIMTWMCIIMCTLFSFGIIIFSTESVIEVKKSSLEEIKKSESIINYISNINDYDYSETLMTISDIENKATLVMFEIILPSVENLSGLVLLIIGLIRILKYIKSFSEIKLLFTKEKYKSLYTSCMILYFSLFFLIKNLVIWLAIGIFIELLLLIYHSSLSSIHKCDNQ